MSGHATPAWRVVMDGEDVTRRIDPRLLSLTLTECRGQDADQLDLVIHDHDGAVALPRRGVYLTVAIGTRQRGLVDKGVFRVDEVEHSGAPDVISIRARSADFTQAMRIRRSRSWHGETLGSIVAGIAGEHQLRARIDPDLAPINVKHLDQADESDVHLLSQLATRYDATMAIKDRSLLFLKIGGGQPLDMRSPAKVTIARSDGDQHRYVVADRESYSGVRAYWTDKAGATRKSVLAGDGENAKRLRETFDTERVAMEHAQAEWKRLQRGEATLSYTLAIGRADVTPEQHVTMRGFKQQIDETPWLLTKVTHTITGSTGFSTALEMETLQGAADDAEAADVDNP